MWGFFIRNMALDAWEVCKGEEGLSVCNGQGISVEVQGKTPAWLRRQHETVRGAKACWRVWSV